MLSNLENLNVENDTSIEKDNVFELQDDVISEEEKENKPKRRKKKQQSSQDTLFDAISSSGAINTLVKDWIDSYKLNSQDGIQELVNFLIKASGCSIPINSEAIQDSDLIPDALDHLESNYSASDYPLLKGKKGSAQLRKRFMDFWNRLVLALKSDILFDDEDGCVEVMLQWLATMSSSACRPFRHTATLAALSVLSGLCTVTGSVYQELTKLSQGKTKAKERIQVLEGNKTTLQVFQSDLFNGVFVHRYRDTDPLIRADCIHELGVWVSKCPDVFLDSQYLRYLGWMLNDKVPGVRLNCVKAMGLLFTIELASGLRSFAERFKTRMISMALYEKDSHVRQEVVKTLGQMNLLGFLDDEDTLKLSVLIMDGDAKVREQMASFIVDYWKVEFLEPLNEVVENRATEKQAGMAKEKIGIKSMCEMLLTISERAYQSTNEVVKQQGKIQVEEFKNGPRFASTKAHDGIEPLISFEIQGIVVWMKRYPCLNEKMGFENIQAAISVLIQDEPLLEDIEMIFGYLMTESVTDSNDYESLLHLSEDQTLCLVYVLTSVLILLVDSPHKTKAEQEKYADAQHCLINKIPKLITKYAKEFRGFGFDILYECVGLLGYVDLEFIVKQHLNAPFEEVVKKLTELTMVHSSPLMLKEIAKVLGHFSVTESTDTNLVALTNSAKTIVNETIELLLTDLTGLSVQLNDYAPESLQDESVLATLQTISTYLGRLFHLSLSFPVFTSLAATNYEYDRSIGPFALMNACLEGALQVLKVHVDSPVDQSQSFYQYCNEILYCATKLMAGEYINSVSRLVEEESQEAIEVVKSKQERLFNFLEAVASDVHGEFFQIQFTYFQRTLCLDTLAEICAVLTGAVVQKYPVLKRSISEKVQKEAFVLVKNLLQVFVYEMPGVATQVTAQQSLQFRYDLFALVGSLMNATTRGMIKVDGLAYLLSFYGFSNDSGRVWPLSRDAISEEKLECPPSVLGEVWNGLCDHVLKTIVGDFYEHVDRLFVLELEQELKLVRIQEYCKSIFVMLTESIQKSIELFMTKKSPSLDYSEALVKAIVGQLKSWTSHLTNQTFVKRNAELKTTRSPLNFIQQVQEIIVKELITSFANAIKNHGLRLKEWRKIADKAEMDVDMTFQTTFDDTERTELLRNWQDAQDIIIDVEPVQESWKVWSLFAGIVSQLTTHLEYSFSVPEIMETVRDQMNDLDTEQGWEACLGVLQHGPSKPKKKATRRKRAPASPKLSPESTPKQKRTSRRLSKKLKQESETEESEMEKGSDSEPELKRARSPEAVEFQSSPEMSSVKRRRQ